MSSQIWSQSVLKWIHLTDLTLLKLFGNVQVYVNDKVESSDKSL